MKIFHAIFLPSLLSSYKLLSLQFYSEFLISFFVSLPFWILMYNIVPKVEHAVFFDFIPSVLIYMNING